jgi:amidase
MDDIAFTSASELASQLRERDLSAVELLEHYLARVATHNPTLNAVVTLDRERALARAREADAALARGKSWGALHGVPVTIKDALATAGLRTTGAYEPLAEHVPTADATAVARLTAAGAIVFGKTNLPVLSGDYQSDNPIFGRTNNPWNVAHCPGGSSGGSAAAIAAGLTALELGSDYSGSIRIPAHYCGVYGLRPSEWRVPTTGHIPPLPGEPQLDGHVNTIGPLARSLDDIELALRLIAGPDGQDWQVPPSALEPARASSNAHQRTTAPTWPTPGRRSSSCRCWSRARPRRTTRRRCWRASRLAPTLLILQSVA